MAGMPKIKPVIGEVIPGSRAEKLGLKPNDEILKINEHSIKNWSDLIYILRHHKGDRIVLYIKRGERRLSIEVFPHPDPKYGYLLGIRPRGDFYYGEPLPPHKAILAAFIKGAYITLGMLEGIVSLFKGGGHAKLTGPVGIVKQGKKQLSKGWRLFFSFVATLSIALFLLNMLPLPALDGAHIAFLIIGVIIRKPINKKIEAIVHSIGFIFLLIVLILVTIRDIFEK